MRKIKRISEYEMFSRAGQFIAPALCFFVGVCLLAFPDEARQSVSDALSLCSETVIASLFPFLFLSTFVSESEIIGSGGRALSFLSRKLFALPADGIIVFIMSAIGGFPVGAKMTSSLLEKEKISESTAKRLVLSCVSPSPAFAVTAVGFSLFSCSKTGIIIYASVTASNLIVLFLSRFVFPGADDYEYSPERARPKLSSAFVSAGRKSSEAMISVCGYVILFSCLCAVMKNFISDEGILSALCAVFEVTTGCERLAGLSNIPLIAGVICFGGLSVHFQIMNEIEQTGAGIKLFFAARVISASLSILICDALLKIFPQAQTVIAMNKSLTLCRTQTNTPVSIMMLLSCFMFLIGDYTLRIRRERTDRTNRKKC